jgi:hypothetical protein
MFFGRFDFDELWPILFWKEVKEWNAHPSARKCLFRTALHWQKKKKHAVMSSAQRAARRAKDFAHAEKKNF